MRYWLPLVLVLTLACGRAAAGTDNESPWPPAPPEPPAAAPAPPPAPPTKADLERIYMQWLQKVRLIEIHNLRPNDEKAWQEGRQELLAIDDEAAIGPVVQVLYGPNPRYRGLLIEFLARLAARKSAVATAYLQEIAVGDSSDPHRHKAVDALKAAGGATPITDRLLVHLSLDQVGVFRDRAATALAALGERRAIRLMIERLVTEEVRTTLVEENAVLPIAPPDATLVGVPAFRQVTVQAGSAGGVFSQSTVNMSQVNVNDYGTAALQVIKQTVPESQRVVVEHAEIRAALKVLTGKDFGFDVDAWRTWSKSAEAERIVPKWEPMKFAAE